MVLEIIWRRISAWWYLTAVLAAACFKHELAENLRLCVPPCAEPAILQNNALYPYIARENPQPRAAGKPAIPE